MKKEQTEYEKRIKKEQEHKPAPFLEQAGIFMGILFVSANLSALMPKSFPVPTPVWGLLILYILLSTKIVKLYQVEKMGEFLIGLIGFLFVPSGIQLYKDLSTIGSAGVPLILAIIIATIILLVVVSYTAIIIIKIKKKITSK